MGSNTTQEPTSTPGKIFKQVPLRLSSVNRRKAFEACMVLSIGCDD